MTNLHNQLASEPYLTKRTQLVTDRDAIETQRTLEISNLSTIRTYTESLSNNTAYASLAEDTQLRSLMAKTSQTTAWQDYFNNYEERASKINPIYDTKVDSDKESIIDQALRDTGLTLDIDYVDLNAVVKKAKKDSRIDTKGFDRLTSEQTITNSCTQLLINTSNISVYSQSKLLLNNMNNYDRQQIADALDSNESSNTLS